MAGSAAAQSPGASETSTEPTLAQEFSSAPKPGQSAATATIGGQVQGGRTETKGVTANGIFAHTTMKKQLFRVDVETAYARYRAVPDTPSFVVENNKLATLTFLQQVKNRGRLFGMTGWRRDDILGLDYRAWLEGGAGVVAIAEKRVNAFIGGSSSVGKEHRNHTTKGSNVLDVGILQSFNVVITNVLGFEEWYKGHVDTSDTDDNSYTLNASFTAKVSKHAGMKIFYKRQYRFPARSLGPGAADHVRRRLQISFASAPKKAPETAPAKP